MDGQECSQKRRKERLRQRRKPAHHFFYFFWHNSGMNRQSHHEDVFLFCAWHNSFSMGVFGPHVSRSTSLLSWQSSRTVFNVPSCLLWKHCVTVLWSWKKRGQTPPQFFQEISLKNECGRSSSSCECCYFWKWRYHSREKTFFFVNHERNPQIKRENFFSLSFEKLSWLFSED